MRSSLSNIGNLFSVSVLTLLCTISCGKKDKAETESSPIVLKYASLLSISKQQGYTIATIADPWHPDKILHRYVLVPRNSVQNHTSLPKGTVIQIPLQRLAVSGSAHAWLLCQLGAAHQIAAVMDLKYMNIPIIQQLVAADSIISCGDGMAPDIERLITSKADALLLTPFQNSGGYGSIERLGIPIIECADYMENSPLARSEWMKFYGLLVGCDRLATSLFNEVEANYKQQKNDAAKLGKGRSLLTERLTGSVWYVPGGKSWAGQLISDAAGHYLFDDDSHSGSLPLAPEQVLLHAESINAWLIKTNTPHPISRASLLSEYHGYAHLKAFQKGDIYVCNTIQCPYFEETTFRPDWLLSDFIKIAHPTACNSDSLRYYQHLAE